MPTEVPFQPLALPHEDVRYAHGPDSMPRADVTPGDVTELTLDDSRVFPGTRRRLWVHTPAGHDRGRAANVTVFNDGWWYLDPDGDVRGAAVLDNLAAVRAIPPTVGVFVDPGVIDAPDGPAKHRNAEYDAFDGRYAAFLLEEVLPLVETHVTLRDGSRHRAVVGGSSGGNAAFTAAWCRPDAFGGVVAFNPSFAQMPGGNPYPALLDTMPCPEARIFLHAAHRDLGWNQPTDNWFAESLEVAAALARTGSDFRLALGDGGHSPNHGGVLLPDALRWLWRD